MELVVLGSGTVEPSPRRTAPAHWVEAGQVKMLFDCGAGALLRAAQFSIPWHEVTHVALTHFHVDHWGELPMLIFALRWGVEPPRSDPLTLIGPAGTRSRLDRLASTFGNWVTHPDGYELEVVELPPPGEMELPGGVGLATHATPHTEESMAYRVTHEGATLVYTGDTGPSEELAAWAAGCDLLLAECSLPEDRAIGVHLTPARAGEMARAAGAGRLVLTHFYSPVEKVDPAREAARVFGGEVTAAEDGDRFAVGETQC